MVPNVSKGKKTVHHIKKVHRNTNKKYQIVRFHEKFVLKIAVYSVFPLVFLQGFVLISISVDVKVRNFRY
jgi:hypothetical protein